MHHGDLSTGARPQRPLSVKIHRDIVLAGKYRADEGSARVRFKASALSRVTLFCDRTLASVIHTEHQMHVVISHIVCDIEGPRQYPG